MEQMCEGESPRSDPISSDCVETTAYTLLALLEAGETDRTGCLAQWLIKQQNSFGSFGSSQVSHEASLETCVCERIMKDTVDVSVGVSSGHVWFSGHIGQLFVACLWCQCAYIVHTLKYSLCIVQS